MITLCFYRCDANRRTGSRNRGQLSNPKISESARRQLIQLCLLVWLWSGAAYAGGLSDVRPTFNLEAKAGAFSWCISEASTDGWCMLMWELNRCVYMCINEYYINLHNVFWIICIYIYKNVNIIVACVCVCFKGFAWWLLACSMAICSLFFQMQSHVMLRVAFAMGDLHQTYQWEMYTGNLWIHRQFMEIDGGLWRAGSSARRLHVF